jgi:UDP-3-O-[3-hydroxymyristoyl] N-acetylglucosamine deacetylase
VKKQQTLAHSFTLEGVGIHTGMQGWVKIHPAEVNTGRMFRIGKLSFPAHADHVVDTVRSTTLGYEGARISTVEHLLSALHGCGIDNAWIEVSSPEIPILDGSALPFVEAIRAVGIEEQTQEVKSVTLTRSIEIEAGASRVLGEPAEGLALEVHTRFEAWPEGDATLQISLVPGTSAHYTAAIAPARTFVFRQEVESILEAGLARGGSLDNALIVTPPRSFSTPLRLPAEWCAHKMLDVIGDLALVNARLNAKLTLTRPGHRINILCAKALLAQRRAEEE